MLRSELDTVKQPPPKAVGAVPVTLSPLALSSESLDAVQRTVQPSTFSFCFAHTMATRRTATPEPADLRQRILDTSRALLNEHGVAALSLREVARRAGVTHQAPHHHFTDRESILAELVTQGFDELTLRLAKANRMVTSHSRLEMLVASGRAYAGFAQHLLTQVPAPTKA